MNAFVEDIEQLMAESAVAFTADQGGCAKARAVLASEEGAFDADTWSRIGELGWFGIAVPESEGGLALGARALVVVAEAAGGALLMPPLVAAVGAAQLLAASASQPGRHALQELLKARSHLAFARGRRQLAAPQALVAIAVPDADQARGGVLVACGAAREFELRLMPHFGDGLKLDRLVDGTRLGTLSIAPQAWADAPLIAGGEGAEAAWVSAGNLVRLGDAAYLCGLARQALTMSLDYMRLRQQFGVPIGSFQALQHRAADAHVQTAAARALVDEAARAFGTALEGWAAAAAVRRAGQMALQVTKEVVQFHGAIGFAHEHDAGLYLRRAMVVSARHASEALACLSAAGVRS